MYIFDNMLRVVACNITPSFKGYRANKKNDIIYNNNVAIFK